ncbi:DUF2933 domain-containing protein [Cupriavidus gilardii]|uniref:DUF2933 domain-containing protein n=1 Tax=Cupriavidus gilardii TaxID=82541 RepID=UPI001ABE666B|nr:DUF2933 domain-containing protein [Cupriavidus gilardii]MBO4120567.1 DUF2933 domain-containing protein [Cupriavidus gilardii]
MKCNPKAMITAGIALAAMLAAAYALLPPVRALVLGIGPYLLLLICPLSMWLIKSMSAQDDQVGGMTEQAPKQKPHPFRIKE